MKIGNGLKILAAVFVALLIGATFPMWKGNLPTFLRGNETGSSKLLGEISSEGISSISLKQGENEVKLTRSGENWLANGKKAKQDDVSEFIENLREAEWGDLASKNPENHQNLQVDDESGVLVTIKETDKEVVFIAGKSGRTFGTFHARKPDEDNVYLAKGDIIGFARTSESGWWDKTIINLTAGTVGKAEIAGAKYLTVDEGKIGNALSPLTASNFLSDAEREEFEGAWGKSIVEVFGKGEGGTVLAKLEVLPQENEYWMKVLMDSSGIDVEAGTQEPVEIYKVSAGNFDSVFENL